MNELDDRDDPFFDGTDDEMYDPFFGGLEYLKEVVLEGVTLEEIANKDLKWCAAIHNLMVVMTFGGQWQEEVFKDPEYYYGRVMVALTQRIQSFGIRFTPMEIVKITEEPA
jgi:hypothetical protein